MSDSVQHRHIHLDTLGGIAGDMFVSAMLTCFSTELAELEAVIAEAGFVDLVHLSLEDYNDGILTGLKFTVSEQGEHEHEHASGHGHRHYSEIRDRLHNSGLDDDTRAHALGIFYLLAEAEAAVHGKAIDEVAFHEVGAWDSIADIVIAAWLIARSSADSWSVSSLPAGSGFIESAHGRLPVPAPAVSLLLQGFRFHDDGLQGERITPTGAAILRYLQPQAVRPAGRLTLLTSGFGFGSRRFAGLSNVLGVTVYDAADKPEEDDNELLWETGTVTEISFEVDDMTGEDLAQALDTLRAQQGVLDVLDYSAQGKKGRPVFCVRLLCEASAAEAVKHSCFNQTSTLGLREQTTSRHSLPRIHMSVTVDDRDYRVKLTQRPSGEVSMKAEMDDIAGVSSDLNVRQRLRQDIEQAVMESLAAGSIEHTPDDDLDQQD